MKDMSDLWYILSSKVLNTGERVRHVQESILKPYLVQFERAIVTFSIAFYILLMD